MKGSWVVMTTAMLASMSMAAIAHETGTPRGEPTILAQAGSMPQGTGGVGMEGKVGGNAKTPSANAKRKEALAACNAMASGPAKEKCLMDYRNKMGNLTQLPSGEWSASQ